MPIRRRSSDGRWTLTHHGYEYTVDRNTRRHEFWKCTTEGCDGQVLLGQEEPTDPKETSPHCHPPELYNNQERGRPEQEDETFSMMPSIRESNGGIELEEEEMDNCDQDEEDDSGSGSADDQMEDQDDDEGGTSEIDSEECDRRKAEYADDMMELSDQFCQLKDQLFTERKALIDLRLVAISKDKDPAYLSQLDRLDRNRKHRKEVADVRDELKRKSIQERFKSEEMAVAQNMKNDIDILFDQLKQELEDKIKRLEEDRHSVDFAPDFFESQNDRAKHRSHPYNSERRKKAAQVTGPYIVYNLADDDILNDWTIIKRSLSPFDR